MTGEQLNGLLAQLDAYRTALQRIASTNSGVWGQVASDALRAGDKAAADAGLGFRPQRLSIPDPPQDDPTKENR